MGSNSLRISSDELKKWVRNTLIFLAPAALVFLLKIQAGGSVRDALLAVELWGLNVVIDFLRKFVPDTTK